MPVALPPLDGLTDSVSGWAVQVKVIWTSDTSAESL